MSPSITAPTALKPYASTLSPSVDASLIHAPRHRISLLVGAQLHGQRRRSRRGRELARPVGIWNLGQSCHLGAVVTALSSLTSLRLWLRGHTCIPSQLVPLHTALFHAASARPRTGALDPRPLLSLLSTECHIAHAQDAHETLLRLHELLMTDRRAHGLNCMLSSKRPDGMIARLALRSSPLCAESPLTTLCLATRTCLQCGCVAPARVERTVALSVPAPQQSAGIAALLAAAATPARVDVDCARCGGMTAHARAVTIARPPTVLVVHVARAIANGFSGHTSAARAEVHVANGLYVAGTYFRVRAVVYHFGDAAGVRAHFVCRVRSEIGVDDGLRGIAGAETWWLVDDDCVVQRSFSPEWCASAVYMIFYERADSDWIESRKVS